jgi:mono/diheme cytochrome c family protein
MKPKALITMMIITALIVANLAFKYKGDHKPWPVPDKFKNMKNPVASNAESIAAGKALWTTHCKSCHGAKGMGDGVKASQLKTEPGDFTKAVVQAETDGELFYKISEGREDMPAFKKKIPDEEDRWSVVNFTRTFKK